MSHLEDVITAIGNDVKMLTDKFNLYIPTSNKSDEVNSTSSTTVATSQAVSSAYQLATQAKDIAQSKQSPADSLSGYGITNFKVETARGNLNHYTTPGLYSFNSLSTSQNRPGSFTGNLFVVSGGIGNEKWCHQIFKRHYSGETYERWQTSGSNLNWSAWKRSDNLINEVPQVVWFGRISGDEDEDQADNRYVRNGNEITLSTPIYNRHVLFYIQREETHQLEENLVQIIPAFIPKAFPFKHNLAYFNLASHYDVSSYIHMVIGITFVNDRTLKITGLGSSCLKAIYLF